MRVLLSTIGSRGDVQPLVALGIELRALGHEARFVVPPDFAEWINSLGFAVTTIGPSLRKTAKPPVMSPPSPPIDRRGLIAQTLAAQFTTLSAAATSCDVMVGASAIQVAAPSVAERRGIPYVFIAYAPVVLPSPTHAPPVLAMLGDRVAPTMTDYTTLWQADAERWNTGWRDALNEHRHSLGLRPVDDVRSHVHTAHPWLAADAALAPWPDAADRRVLQTGAWLLTDHHPLPPALERFLDAGDPPIYLGFGSIRPPEAIANHLVHAARSHGKRAIVSRGWSDLMPPDHAKDVFSLGDVNQQALFPRVAAVVHHGGAGTTTAAARAGVPQLIVPQHYDQHYFAHRIEELGIGVAHPPVPPTEKSVAMLLQRVLVGSVTSHARSFASRIRDDGARVAAMTLLHR